ncbi:MAG: Crp/Fnr family transcriptional regulator [Alphaproteobacteria bacterium]|nr:MAG: Crp/Fnr family transcriptional regulator [Alphaproteobacteria bacterium]
MSGAAKGAAPIRAALARLGCDRRIAAPGEVIAAAGEAPGRVGLILGGWLYHLRTEPDGRRQITDLMTAGDLVAPGFPCGAAPGLAAYALTRAELCEFEGESLLRASNADPELRLWLMALMQRQRRRLEARLVDLGLRSGSERAARALVEIAMREGTGRPPARSLDLSLPLSLRFFGELLGLSTAHVCRIFKDFERRDVAHYETGRVRIHDFERLMRLGNVTPAELATFAASAAAPPDLPPETCAEAR